MKQKIKEFIKNWKNQPNFLIKINCSFFITGCLFLIFSTILKAQNFIETSSVFAFFSGIGLGAWLSFNQNQDSLKSFFKELGKLTIFILILIFSLNFCLNTCIEKHGLYLLLHTLISFLGLLYCSYYLVTKFVNIFTTFKSIFIKIKQKIFSSAQPSPSKLKSLIENITAFLVSIAGLGVAIKAVIEPLIKLFT